MSIVNENELERKENELDRIKNENARRIAENTRIARENARENAEINRNAIFEENEAIRNEAEKLREKAEAKRKENFNNLESLNETLNEAESERVKAEGSRESKETERQLAEIAREKAEANREKTYTNFNDAEVDRINNENARIQAENLRVQAESIRAERFEATQSTRETKFEEAQNTRDELFKENETARATEEIAREQAESIREGNEAIRNNSETLRESAENLRQQEEIKRSQSEVLRAEAEEERELSYEEIKKDNSTFKEEINAIVNNYKEETDNVIDEYKTDIDESISELDEKFGNAKVDYFGEEHLDVVDRLNSDFDNVHQRINDASYLEYSGANITANNSYYGLTKEMNIKGRTLQNILINKTNIVFNFATSKSENSWGFVNYTPNDVLLRPSTVYTFVVNVTKNTVNNTNNTNLVWFGNVSSAENNYYFPSGNNGLYKGLFKVGTTVFKLTTKPTFTNETIAFATQYEKTINEGVLEFSLIILVGDYTNTPISELPFIEGIKSVGESEVTEEDKYPVKVKSCGKNLLDDTKIIKGYYLDNQGLEVPDSSNYYSDFIRVYAGTTLYKKYENSFCYYDMNKNFIKRIDDLTNTIVIVQNGFIRFNGFIDNIYNESITSSTDTDYEPYQESIQELLLNEPLRSLSNEIYDEILEDGEEIRRVGKIVLDGSENWKSVGGSADSILFYTTFNAKPCLINKTNPVVCNNFSYSSIPLDSQDYEGIYTAYDGNICIRILKSKLSTQDVAGFKNWLSENPTTVYYELSEPIITKHNVNMNLKTFEGTTHITSDNYLQPSINCKVPSNVQAIVSNLIEENKTLNNTISAMSLENEEAELENIETNLDQDVRLTMLELGVM